MDASVECEAATETAPEEWTKRVRRWVFERHAHPISAWSRWATTPLILVPLWTRDPRTIAPVAAWFMINPVMTPPITDDRAFATRAMLGEEERSVDPQTSPSLVVVNVLNSSALIGAAVGAWRQDKPLTIGGTVGSLALTLLSWHMYAGIYIESAQRR